MNIAQFLQYCIRIIQDLSAGALLHRLPECFIALILFCGLRLAWDVIHSVTLLFIKDVISADKVEMCPTSKVIRLWSAFVKSMS